MKYKKETLEQIKKYGYYKPENLLTSSDAKTTKGEKIGYKTYIMYLSPASQNSLGINICPFASKDCTKLCLFSAGRGKFDNVKKGRINKTEYYLKDKKGFLEQLKKEITKISKRHKKNGKKYAIRLNGTSDLNFSHIIKQFPEVQFYDYTKGLNRAIKNKLPNYDITFSMSESNHKEVAIALYNRIRTAIVTSFDFSKYKSLYNYPVIDGDYTDLRFLDGFGLVLLKAKGDATKGIDSGFIIKDKKDLKKLLA